MQRTLSLLALIVFTLDSPREILVRAKPALRNDDYGDLRNIRGTVENYNETLWRRRLPNDKEESSKLVGKWRRNGEALEPKWRDGDSVPLFPFLHFSSGSYAREDEDATEQAEERESQRTFERGNVQANRRSKNFNRQIPRSDDYEDYELPVKPRAYAEHNDDSIRTYLRTDTLSTSIPFATTDEDKHEDKTDSKVKQATSRYREVLQARPNDYEHELNDEEYLKPRPRKRRPPQNYEFALASSSTSREEKPTEDREAFPRNGYVEPEFMKKNRRVSSDNAIELKFLLKMQQEEGLSLSEILQQRNLTLTDLLKGKADVINALRSKNLDDTSEYMQDAAKAVSDSLMKISVTNRPQWISELESAKLNISDTRNKLIGTVESIGASKTKDSIDIKTTPLDNADHTKLYTKVKKTSTENSTYVTLDSTWRKAEAPANVLTTVTTTDGPPVIVVTNSMELYQNDDGNGRSDNNQKTKADDFDEDEIMEFSDFTDFKKGKNVMQPIWLSVPKQENSAYYQSDDHHDVGSTLSIEHILRPTERIVHADNSSMVTTTQESETEIPSSDEKREKSTENDEPSTTYEYPAEDCDVSCEFEYQDDAPLDATQDYTKGEEISLTGTVNDGSEKIIKDRPMILTTTKYEDENLSFENHQVRDQSKDSRLYNGASTNVEPGARSEIFELFASGSAGKRLERLLKSRNMSIEELIALRQRGSSEVHLAEVSRLKEQKPKALQPTDESNSKTEAIEEIVTTLSYNKVNLNYVKQTVSNNETEAHKTLGKNDTNFNGHEEKNINENSTVKLNFSIVETVSVNSNEKHSDVEQFAKTTVNPSGDERRHTKERIVEERTSLSAIQIMDILTTFSSLPFGKDIHREYAAEVTTQGKILKGKTSEDVPSMIFSQNEAETATRIPGNVIQTGYVEEITRENSILTDTETTRNVVDDKNGNDEIRALSKVKPSIIASGAILGVTIVVFLAIFIVCRIRQKQRYIYRNTFSRAVFQGPMMAARKLSNSSSLSTVMVNVVATSTAKRPERNETRETVDSFDRKSDIDNDSLDANDSWETIPDYMK